MHGVHPLGDLAPRDVVATAIAMRLREAPGGVDDHVYLDATSIGADLPRRFPTIVERCRAAGVDPVVDPIPVAPAAHFACGGVRARLDGTTSMPGLFAIGEVAATGLHGANRLASNGVTEGLVAGRLVAERLAEALPESGAPAEGAASGLLPVAVPGSRSALARAMSRSVGPLRDADGLSDVLGRISASPADRPAPISSLAEVEATNLRTVSTLVSRAALAREESRGSHRRLDFGQPSDAWQGRLVQRWDGAETSLRFEPLRHQEGQP
jgi:L-aspartate oxidase